ncbi:MAG: homoserine dehydrogenase [Candidatus Omnitrophota bacterium]
MITRVGIIGLGNVGEATLKLLKKSSSLIAHRTSLKIDVKGICDSQSSKRRLSSKFSTFFTTNPYDLINDPKIDVIVELIGGIDPARKIIIESLKKQKNVVTANKALLAQSGNEIFSLAESKQRRVGFEASVCGAIPLIKSISEGLVGCEVRNLYGIVNGTTNYILYQMGKAHIDFASALADAKLHGFAERKASFDIEGIDSLHKLCILCYLCFGVWPKPDKIYTEGISKISLLDIIYTRQLNYRIKLLALAKKEKNTLDIRVHPALVPVSHPFSQTTLAYNAVYLDTYPAGNLLFYGQGAGGTATSSSVVSDIVNVSFNTRGFSRKQENFSFKNIKATSSRYYIRLMAKDRPGVLAMISRVLASLNISIASVSQKERNKEQFVPIVMITHEAKEESVKKALSKIDSSSLIKNPTQLIRIEDL